MSVQVVVARYCEDLSWMTLLPGSWRRQVYDKSQGGPRMGLRTSMYASPGGPDRAPTWPGAAALANVGCEAHTYLHHVVTRYDELADVTVFLQGGPHYPEIVPGGIEDAVGKAARAGFAPLGHPQNCDATGRPHHDEGLPELPVMWHAFFATAVPPRLEWWSAAQFAVARDRVRAIPRSSWFAARNLCSTKLHACAMERLWAELFKRRG